MKIYATEIKRGEVVVNQWPSKKAFESTESWVDPKFIHVATAKDLVDYIDEPYSMVIQNPERIASRKALQQLAVAK